MSIHKDQILALAKEAGILQPKDLAPYGISPMVLQRLYEERRLERVGWGMYILPDQPVSEHFGLAMASKRIPHGVIALLSALSFHGLTTQLPHRVWMAVERSTRSRAKNIELIRLKGKTFSAGVEYHTIDGIPVAIYSPSKTVADCFKFRRRVGLDVALEALRDYIQQRGSVDELWEYARIDQVNNIMQPYLEAIV